MHFTRISFVTFALALTLGSGALSLAACGQVTGLSNDYVFDLQQDGGGIAPDAKGDGASGITDAPVDVVADVATEAAAEAGKCSASDKTMAEEHLSQDTGSMPCKDCLATECCTEVDTCSGTGDCRKALACRLDCTTKAGLDRHTCLQICNSNTGGNTTPTSYTNGVGACAASSCATTATCGGL